MKPQGIAVNELESLSALVDGELADEERRFALRRLSHDASWQDTAGRWQLLGDAMRRQAPAVAPADFASRVQRAVAAEPVVVPVLVHARAAAVPAARSRRRVAAWAGGALAASVAMAAVIGLRAPDAPDAAAPQQVAELPAVVAPAADEPVRTAPGLRARPSTAVAVAPRVQQLDAPGPVTTARRLAAPSAPRLVRGASSGPRVRPAAAAAPTLGSGGTVLVADVDNPFRLQAADAIDARPWPRTVAAASGAAFTTRYGSGRQSAADAPSFYPFEPRLEGSAEPAEAAPVP